MSDEPRIGDEMSPRFFTTAAEFEAWLEENHEREGELWIGMYRKASGIPSITWPEVVDVALCFGWIDGIRKSHDAQSYKNRVTPRRKRSNWSAVNVRRIQELAAEGRVRPAGMAAFEVGAGAKPANSSHEQTQEPELCDEFETLFKAQPTAWDYFQASAPWYRRAAIWWVVSAKKDETRRRRLDTLIADSAAGRRIAPLDRRKTSG